MSEHWYLQRADPRGPAVSSIKDSSVLSVTVYSEPANDCNHNAANVIKILFLQTANYSVITLLTLETAASKHSQGACPCVTSGRIPHIF